MKLKQTLATALTFILLSTSCYSQTINVNRIEFELKNGYAKERILEFGNNGFLLASRAKNTEGKIREWKFEKYNTNLKSVDSKSIYLEKKYYLKRSFKSKNRSHNLFITLKDDFTVITIDANNLSATKTTGVLPKKAMIDDMAVLGDFIYLKAKIKREPFLISINWKTGQKKLIPISIEGVRMKITTVEQFQVSEKNKDVFVFIKVPRPKRKVDTYVLRLDDQGNKKALFNLTENLDKNLVEISASKVSGGKYIYTGTYSNKSSITSEGLFFCSAKKDKIENIKFYNFIDLETFLNYLPEKKQERIKKKQERKAQKGKELSYNFRIAPHGIIETDDGYMFLGEAYYATYHTETYTETIYRNNQRETITKTKRVFDGFQYTHATLAKFSKTGDLQWDQTFELWPAEKPMSVKTYVSIAEQKQKSIKLAYANLSLINSKSFDFEGNILKEYKSDEIETKYDTDKTKYTISNINFWYDNYFISYGTQVIKNKEEKGKKKRKVYFVSKVEFK